MTRLRGVLMEIGNGSASVSGAPNVANAFGGPFKYCPKCGAAALRMTGQKLLRCAACGFELYLNVAAAVAGVIVDEQGRMVVLVRGKEPGKGKWDLPGGFVDPGDTAEEALRREVREEIGLEVTGLRYLGSWPNVYEYMGVRYRTLDLGFVCEVTQVAQARPMEDEIAEVLFLWPREIDLERFAFPSVAAIAGKCMEQGSDVRGRGAEAEGRGE